MTAPTDRLPYRIKLESWVPRLFGHQCVTIRRTIYCREPRMSATLHAHEYRHIEQWAEHGVIGFLVRYLWQQVRKGYKANAFEADAHLYATAHVQDFRAVP